VLVHIATASRHHHTSAAGNFCHLHLNNNNNTSICKAHIVGIRAESEAPIDACQQSCVKYKVIPSIQSQGLGLQGQGLDTSRTGILALRAKTKD